MSGPIRKVLGPARHRMQQLLDKPIDHYDPAAHEDDSIAERIRAINAAKLSMIHDVEKLERSINLLKEKDGQWLQLIQTLPADQKDAEEKTYGQHIDATDGHFAQIINGEDKLSQIKTETAELDNMKAALEKQDMRDHIAAAAPAQLPAALAQPPAAPAPMAQAQQLKLPKVELPTFDGDPTTWPAFWDIFESSVHNQQIPGVQKMVYLKSKLTKTAANSISGLPVTNNSYQTAIDILRQRFGKSAIIRTALITKLRQMRIPQPTTKELRSTYDTMERYLRQLDSLGEDVDQPIMSDILMSKLPPETLTEMQKLKKATDPWSVEVIRQALNTVIEDKEEIQRVVQTQQQVHRQQLGSQAKGHSASDQSISSSDGQFTSTIGSMGTNVQQFRGRRQGQKELKFKNSANPGSGAATKYQGAAASNIESSSSFASSTKPKMRCAFCDKPGHYSSDCRDFPTIQTRKTQLMRKRNPIVCTRCIRRNHFGRDCTANLRCFHCKSDRHHTAFCQKTYGDSTAPASANMAGTPESQQPINDSRLAPTSSGQTTIQKVTPVQTASNQTAANSGQRRVKSSMLLTATTIVQNPDDPDKTVKVQLFFDNGSQRTFVKNSLISKLQLMGIILQDLLIFTFGSHKPQYRRSDYVQVDILLRDGSKFPIEADAVDHLSASQTRAPLVLEDQEYIKTHLPESFFADSVPFTAQPFEPDIVIGQDYFWDLITDSTRIQLPSGLYIIPSKLGLLIGGKQMIEVHQSDTRTVDSVLQVQCIMNNCHDATNAPVSFNDSILNPNLEHFWQLENIGITDPSEIIEDDHAIDQFNNSVQYQDQGYYVKWPLNDNIQELPDNKLLALKRFKSLTRRFQAEPELLSKYAQIIPDQVKLGIIEPVNQDVLDGRKFHYLPHHPVITPQKATTKVRVVYDGSARSRHSYSVNDCLLRGQVILPDLCGLLLRFQLPSIAMVADIEKAFLQVGLQDADRDLTRFWFYKDPSKADYSDSNLQIYRFCRVPFGIISSPFLLAATIKFHLGQYDNQVAQLILDNIYVDNVIIGVHSVQQAIEAYHRSKDMFKTASMNLREWISYSTAFNDQVPAHDKVQQTIVKVLGLRWDTQHDLFLMAGPKSKTDDLVTKRTIIQTVSSIFDPLGFASPVTLKGKLFIQKLWQKLLDWDQAVPQELQQEWESILSDLQNLDQIKIPRFMQYCSSQPPAELHAFIDASAKAYAVVIYLRQGNNNNSGFTTHFLFSKVRLSPQEAMTIPRLELLALLIGSRALSFVHQQLNIPISACFIWSDSQCCLQWLITKRPLARFVSNRVKEICQIRQKLPNCSIHYVGTEDNPADVATRGLKVAELHQSNQWWHGPKWLSSDQWPQHHFPPITTKVMEQVEKELTKQSQFHCTLLRFKLLRVTVYCLRFIKSIKKGADCITNFDLQGIQSKGPILASELSIAQLYWNLQTQAEFYSDILESLQSKSPHNMVTSLGLYLDKSGVIRCKGRFQNANIFNGEFPVLLPKDSRSTYTKLVIEHFHEKSFHSGTQYTLAQLRQQFWLPSGRTAIKKTLRNCRHCRKIQGGPYHLPSMATLPKERLQKAKPFQFTGLDYLGPLWYKAQSGDREKAYICLFTCLVTRAVHLELVTDLSAQMFLNALRRFFARRGIPTKVLSDNASRLMLTKSAIQRAWLQMFNDDEVVSYCSAQGIEWKTTTPFAPWQGGIYERLVGLTKNSLKKAVGRKLLTFEQLNTLVPEIEAILNSRPLTYVYSDLESNFILRPIDFLLPSGSIETSAFDNDPKDPEYKPKLDSSDKLIQFWQSSQASLDKFWEFWQKDYLTSLLERTQTDHVQHRIHSPYKPSEGDVVLIQEENVPRGSWKMGKILKLNVSSDRQIRSADIILPSKNVLQRSLSQLHPLEIVHSLAYSSVPEGNTNQSASSSNATTVGTSSRVKDSIGRAPPT